MDLDTRRRMALAVASVAIVIASLPSSGARGAGDTQAAFDEHHVITNEEAVRQDAVMYSADFGVPIEEAIHRLDVQIALGDVIVEIEKASAERFAGGWIEHKPKFRGVVSLTGDGPLPLGVESLALGAPAQVDIVTGAANSLDDLLAGQKRASEYFRAIGLPVTTEVDVRTGSVLVTSERALGLATSAALAATTGVPVRSEVGPMPVRLHTYGGRRVNLGSASQCTTGFTVISQVNQAKGVTTAAHCPDNLEYYETTSLHYPLSFRAKIDDGNQDVQWHTSSHPVFDDFWDGDEYRDVTGTHTRSGSIGIYVCHYGWASAQESPPFGYSCGNVQSITFASPDPICGDPNGPCDPFWVKVTGPSLACYYGDSGGPFWSGGGVAYGTLAQGDFFGTARGQCTIAVYMSVDLLPTPLGIWVLTQ